MKNENWHEDYLPKNEALRKELIARRETEAKKQEILKKRTVYRKRENWEYTIIDLARANVAAACNEQDLTAAIFTLKKELERLKQD